MRAPTSSIRFQPESNPRQYFLRTLIRRNDRQALPAGEEGPPWSHGSRTLSDEPAVTDRGLTGKSAAATSALPRLRPSKKTRRSNGCPHR